MTGFTIVKQIGTAQVFTTLQGWEDGAPSSLTTADKYTCGTFSGSFTQGETVTGGTSGKTAKMLDTDNSSYMSLGDKSGTFTNGETLTGGTSGKTCVITTPATNTGCIWQGQALNQVFTSAGATLTVAGSTTSSTCYKELTTASGASFVDNANKLTNALRYNSSNGMAIESTGSFPDVVSIQESNFHMSKVQINTPTTTNSRALSTTPQDGSVRLSQCIMEGWNSSSSAGGGAVAFYAAGELRQCLIVQRHASAFCILSTGYNNHYGCTFVTPSDIAASTQAMNVQFSGTDLFKNCAFFGASAIIGGSPGTLTITTCYSDISGTSGVTQATYANEFQNTVDSTRDFRLKSGAAQIDTGTTDSTNDGIDIVGTSRPIGSGYDVGVWELASATFTWQDLGTWEARFDPARMVSHT